MPYMGYIAIGVLVLLILIVRWVIRRIRRKKKAD